MCETKSAIAEISAVTEHSPSEKGRFADSTKMVFRELGIARERLAALFHRRAYGTALFRKISITYNITYGQLLLLLPLLLFAVVCYYHTFFKLNTGQSGIWAYYALAYAFLLAHKKASVFRILGISWEQLVPIHHAASVTALVLSALHGYVAYTGHDYSPCREMTAENLLDLNSTQPFCEDMDEYGHRRNLGELRLEDNPRFRHSMIGPEPDVWKYLWDGGRNVSGSWMWACLLSLILLSSLRSTLRKPSFDLWLALHIAASGAILAYSFKHRAELYVVLSIWWGLDGFLRYVVDPLVRLPKTAKLVLLSPRPGHMTSNIDNAVAELRFNRKFSFQAGQYVRVAVMETGQPVMFHPMTISSAPCDDELTIHFRPFGGWTRQLATMASKQGTKTSSVSPDGVGRDVHVLLEGPYGCLSMNLWNNHSCYQTVVLIAGGIGVTPISSLARQLLYEHKHGDRHRKRIHVVWAVRDLSIVEALPVLGHHSNLVDGLKTPPNFPEVQCDMSVDTESPDSDRLSYVADVYLTTDEGEIAVDEDVFEVVPQKNSPSDQQESPDELDVANVLYNEGYDLHPGRPDVQQILQREKVLSKTYANGTTRIAVVACGPNSLVQTTKEECARLTCDSVSFDFHEEIFLY